MKKQIALIIISMLAAMPATAQNVNEKEMCNYPQQTPICEMGSGVIQPDFDEIFGSCPEIPDFRPGFPGFCETPDFGCGETPECPDCDEDIQTKPECPDCEQETPETPDTEIPEQPEIPEETPDTPDVPETPIVPEQPEEEPEEEPDTEAETPANSYAAQVLALVNSERAKYGLSALTYDSTLAQAANIRAQEIKSYFSHTRPNGQSCFTVLDEVGYSYRGAGENIAYGQQSPEEVMTAWMNSEGHRANILGENYTHIGIGVYESGGVIYWSQMFSY